MLSFLVLASGCASLPGSELVSSNGRMVEVSQLPGASPAIVFEAGLGAYKESWRAVLAGLATGNAVFTYNRPGIGRSGLTTHARDGATIVEDLRALLRSRGVGPPYVLVGHSAGGLYMQIFARSYPSEVAGLILVDPTHPTQFEGAGSIESRGSVASAVLGIARMFGQIRAEFDALPETGRQVLAAPALPEGLPTVILVAPNRSGGSIAAFDNAMREDFGRLYPAARLAVVTGGHNIPLENPSAILDAIRAVLGNATP